MTATHPRTPERLMNPIATCAATFMEGHPHPALRLGELLPPVADQVDRSLTLDRLRQALAEHPDAFRLLDPWAGPWRSAGTVPSEVSTVRRRQPCREEDEAEDVWVVWLRDARGAGGPSGDAHLTLRESVRWLAKCIDTRSPLSVSRWYAIALAERESRRALARKSA